ncbi:MAG TPA: LamB/YcsF family protein [Kofleriaceae bacterium]|nr:LamB/YcsF family protein [Kofleriaceae bacterium]HMG57532.1 LamB/YcsF family protein [Kofleriaceae bacterium]
MALMNLDAGEHDDEPEALWALFDVLNIACGGHAGDAASMERVVAWCVGAGRAIGAHPSYPDRPNFGRRSLAIAPAALGQAVGEQCAALAAIARRHDRAVAYVKPHGALYHDAAADPALARAVVTAAADALGDAITVIGPPGGALREAAAARGVGYASEGFADRRMRPDGGLVPRSEPGALLTDPADAAAQARVLAGRVDTICCHADTPGALAIAGAVHRALRG